MRLYLVSLIFCSHILTAQNDKTLHFMAGGLSGYYGASLELSISSNVHPYLTCVGSALIAGTAKELMDRQTTGFDKKDLGATVLGGVFSGTIIYIVKRRHARRNAKRLFR